MNRLAYFLILTALLISCHSNNTMKPDDFPPCDPDGPHLENEPIYRDPPQPEDPGMMTFWGLESGDEDYEAVTVPSDTAPQEIIRKYNVGLQAGISYGYDEEETCALLIEKVNAIARIIPFRVIFADSAGLKLRFTRQITASELKKIEALFPEEEAMQAGLDGYISNWSGEGPLLTPVLEENLVHFWWD